MRLVDDRTWAILTLWCEVRGEPYAGKLAVAEVVRNRMARHYQSDGTVVGTVLRPFQFSCWNTEDPNRRLAATLDDAEPMLSECARAWDEVNGAEPTQVAHGAVLYYAPGAVSRDPPWLGAVHEVASIGRHKFYATGAV